MLLVRTCLAASRLHGIGCFADETIRKGQVVWRFSPGFDLDKPLAEIDALPSQAREALLHYGYVDARLNRFILCCDNARFINHSATPNIVADPERDHYGIDIALTEIAPGEEITIDYGAFEARVAE